MNPLSELNIFDKFLISGVSFISLFLGATEYNPVIGYFAFLATLFSFIFYILLLDIIVLLRNQLNQYRGNE